MLAQCSVSTSLRGWLTPGRLGNLPGLCYKHGLGQMRTSPSNFYLWKRGREPPQQVWRPPAPGLHTCWGGAEPRVVPYRHRFFFLQPWIVFGKMILIVCWAPEH